MACTGFKTFMMETKKTENEIAETMVRSKDIRNSWKRMRWKVKKG